MARRHGCELPYNVPQAACVFIYFLLVAGFASVSAPTLLQTWETAITTTFYAISALAAATLFLITSVIDPSDCGKSSPEEDKSDEDQFYCVLCQVYVKKTSKHCRTCDRCTDGFDHHCKWLNNCVGRSNYWAFFALISCTSIMMIVQFVTGVYLVIISFTRDDEMTMQLEAVYGSGLQLTGFRVLQGVFCGLTVPPGILLGELLFFHIVLQYKGLTTYEYIMAQSEAKKAKAAAQQEEGDDRRAPWRLQILQAGGISTLTMTNRKIRVGINPLALLKMESGDGGGFACGCGSSHKGNSTVHPQVKELVPEEMPSPGPKVQHQLSPTVEDPSYEQLKVGSMPAAESSESDANQLLVPAYAVGPVVSKLMPPVDSNPSSISPSNSKFLLPPIKPPKARKAFDDL